MSHSEVQHFGLVLEIMIQLHRAFGNLMGSVMKYLHTTSFEGDGYHMTREEINERWRQLNWENPAEEEFNSVTVCIQQQNIMLQEDHRQGRETITRKNLINLAKNLWTYLLLNNSIRMWTFSSMYREGGWTQFSNRHVTTFEQRVQMLLQFLKMFAANSRPQASQFTRLNDINLEEFGILDGYSESL